MRTIRNLREKKRRTKQKKQKKMTNLKENQIVACAILPKRHWTTTAIACSQHRAACFADSAQNAAVFGHCLAIFISETPRALAPVHLFNARPDSPSSASESWATRSACGSERAEALLRTKHTIQQQICCFPVSEREEQRGSKEFR
jgi:hypothetical protein